MTAYRIGEDQVADAEHVRDARRLCAAAAAWAEHEDLINLGAYEPGSNPQVDRAIALRPQLLRFLRQDTAECPSFAETRAALAEAVEPPSERAAGAGLPAEPQQRRPQAQQALASFEAAASAGSASQQPEPHAPSDGLR